MIYWLGAVHERIDPMYPLLPISPELKEMLLKEIHLLMLVYNQIYNKP